jgi:integrase/recombinase XerD
VTLKLLDRNERETPATALARTRSTGALATLRRDPREQWPEHARRLYDHLEALYGADDALPTLAADWVAHQRSANTQRYWARGFRIVEEFARNRARSMG